MSELQHSNGTPKALSKMKYNHNISQVFGTPTLSEGPTNSALSVRSFVGPSFDLFIRL